MRRLLAAAGTALLLLTGGCGPVPFEKPQLVATTPLAPEDLAGSHWLNRGGIYRIRQSGLFRIRGREVPLEGLMRLDAGVRSARLVALDPMGVKLFDLTVTPEGFRRHQVLPALERFEGFDGAVAESVRRIFLAPRPEGSDALRIGARRYVLFRSEGERESRFVFGGPRHLLLETEGNGPGERWRVRCFEHRPEDGEWVPGGIVLEDKRAGYRLTLWMEDVKKIDE